MSKNQKVSRREFLAKSGLVVAGATVGAAGLVGFQQPAAAAWPFPYKEIDPEKAAQIAYDGYISGYN